MWSTIDGKVVLDISKITTEFRVTSESGLHLICPRKNLWDWEDGERWLRSIVVDDNGLVVSCSWPKFGNYNEFTQDTTILNQALEQGKEVLYTGKEDGSLCIRSVINGQVIFRTRGTLFGGYSENGEKTFAERFQEVAAKRYPVLLEPNYYSDRSLLFEYVSPTNRIVVSYKEDDLIFLGFIKHSNLRIGHWTEMQVIARQHGFNLVKLYELPRDPIKLLETIEEWDDEGVVVRCNTDRKENDQVLVKIKSAKYLAKHRMKFSMNYKFLVEFIELSGVIDEQGLINRLKAYDYDWEVIEEARKIYEEYDFVQRALVSARNKAKELYNKFQEENSETDVIARKKAYAMIACKQDPVVRPVMFGLYDGKQNKIESLFKKITMAGSKKLPKPYREE